MGDLINEILTRLRLISELKLVSIWNNQTAYLEDGQNYSFPLPCAFVELLNENNGQLLGNYQGSDIVVNIHILQNVLNGALIDENLTIFDLRDLVVKSIANFKADTSGIFVKTSEQQDFDHSNVYHYQISFTTHWIDNTAVPAEYLTTPPTSLTVTHT